MADHPLSYEEFRERYSKPEFTSRISLILDGIEKIENLGLISRTAESVGIHDIYLYDSSLEVDSMKLKRFSRSTSVKISYHSVTSSEILALKEENKSASFIGIELTMESEPLYSVRELPDGQQIFLIAGSESLGVSDKLLSLCGTCLHLPIKGVQSSINLACALSSAMHYFSFLESAKSTSTL